MAEIDDLEQLKAELDAERKRAAELHDRWARAQADLANQRRRFEQERQEIGRAVDATLLAELLSVLDNFDRAFATLPRSLARLTWCEGVSFIHLQLKAILARFGVTPIEALGKPFNPAEHEAVAEEEVTEGEDHRILEEVQTGYRLHGRVLRPALVKIARKAQPLPEPPPAEPTAEPVAPESQAS